MCDCRTRIDEKLAPRNARLAFGFTLGNASMDVTPPLITVEKLAPRGKKPPWLFASFCPFCGEDLRKGEDGAAHIRLMDAAHECLTTLCEWFSQREAGKPTTNSETAMFERVNYVASQIEAAGAPVSSQNRVVK